MTLEERGRMSNAKERITRAVLAYFAANPDAQDTLEGIAEWWPLGTDVKPNISLVEETLTGLVDKGLVLARKGKDARTYYKLNRRRLREIKRLLKRAGETDEPDD